MTYEYSLELEALGNGITLIPRINNAVGYYAFEPTSIVFSPFTEKKKEFKLILDEKI